MSTILPPGVHPDIPSDTYHADPAPEPSLSAGTAHRLITRSPLHAFTEHPRLNPDWKPRETTGGMDFGTAAHSLLLDGLDICQVLEHTDYRKQAARDERDEAHAAGLVPLLRKDYDRMCELVAAVRSQIARLDVRPLPLRDGQPEQTLIWQENGVWLRARVDWLHDAGEHADDLKTTSTTASPFVWARRRLFEGGYDLQSAFYRRGLKALTGVDADWRFVVVETDPPFAVSVISIAPSAVELAERKVDRAIELWKRCMGSGEWPGYPTEIAYAELPAWEEARFLEAHYEETEVVA